MRHWILIANASRARLFLSPNTKSKPVPWILHQEWDHPASRAKGVDLVTDKAGRVQQSAGKGHRPAMAETTEPKEAEAQHFAHELARSLEKGQDRHEYDALTIAAPPHFLGLLRSLLSPPVQKLLLHTMDKDYTQVPARNLPDLIPLERA
jgi:protein required for attachment to host cells